MIIDIVCIGGCIGIALILLYSLKNKKIPELKEVLLFTLYGQSIVTGVLYFLFGLLGNGTLQLDFEKYRIMGMFAGIALLWIAIEGIRSQIKV